VQFNKEIAFNQTSKNCDRKFISPPQSDRPQSKIYNQRSQIHLPQQSDRPQPKINNQRSPLHPQTKKRSHLIKINKQRSPLHLLITKRSPPNQKSTTSD
jgi:hypothetical protein